MYIVSMDGAMSFIVGLVCFIIFIIWFAITFIWESGKLEKFFGLMDTDDDIKDIKDTPKK